MTVFYDLTKPDESALMEELLLAINLSNALMLSLVTRH